MNRNKGLRYIPKLDGEWDNTKEYEHLVIVTYKGDSYTSKKRVPKGIDISNSEYWLLTGSFNAQVEHYRHDVMNVINNVANNNGVNVKLFGAIGDGKNNDTKVLQNCIDTYNAIYLPAGVYLVDTLTIKSNTVIYGENPNTTILLSNGSDIIKTLDFDSLTGSGKNAGASAFEICNVTINGNDNNVCGLLVYGYRYHLNNIYFRNCKRCGFYSEWCRALGIAEDGELMESLIENIRVRGCKFSIQFFGSHDTMFNNCFVYLNDYGIQVTNTETSYANGTIFNNVHIYANKYTGFYANASVICNNVISESNGDMTTDKGVAYGFAIDGDDCVMTNCSAFCNKNNGLLLNASNTHFSGKLYSNGGGVEIHKDLGTNYIEIHEKCNKDSVFVNPNNMNSNSCYMYYARDGYGDYQKS